MLRVQVVRERQGAKRCCVAARTCRLTMGRPSGEIGSLKIFDGWGRSRREDAKKDYKKPHTDVRERRDTPNAPRNPSKNRWRPHDTPRWGEEGVQEWKESGRDPIVARATSRYVKNCSQITEPRGIKTSEDTPRERSHRGRAVSHGHFAARIPRRARSALATNERRRSRKVRGLSTEKRRTRGFAHSEKGPTITSQTCSVLRPVEKKTPGEGGGNKPHLWYSNNLSRRVDEKKRKVRCAQLAHSSNSKCDSCHHHSPSKKVF